MCDTRLRRFRQFIAVNALIGCLLTTTLCQGDEPTRPQPVVLRLPHYHDLLYAAVAIEGQEHQFVLDTGSQVHVFDHRLKSYLGPPIRTARTVDSEGIKSETELFHPPICQVEKLELSPNAAVVCVDLEPVRQAIGKEIEGILGMPFFATHVVQVDFDQRKLRIWPGSVTPSSDWGEAVPVAGFVKHSPAVYADFTGLPDEPITIDTGFRGTISLRSGLYDQLVSRSEINPLGTTYRTTLNQGVLLAEGTLSTIKVAGNTHHKLTVERSQSDSSRIGLEYLRRYKATFDVARGRIHLARGFDYDSPEDDIRLGVRFLRKIDATVVDEVEPNGWADSVGIETGDEVLAVGGRTTSSKPIAEVEWTFENAIRSDRELVIRVRRAGKPISLPTDGGK
nr:aspartyl protease family protein [Aeoliella straminimaris]